MNKVNRDLKNNKNKVLFVTNRNVLTTSGELRLIKNRAEALYNLYNISTDFIVLAQKERISSPKREEIKAGGVFKLYPFNLKDIISNIQQYRKMKNELLEMVATGNYGAVVLSGSGLLFLTKEIKNKGKIKVLIDIHGALEENKEFKRVGKKLKNYVVNFLSWLEINFGNSFVREADGFFVVTESLKEDIKRNYTIKQKTKFFKVPCALNSKNMDGETYNSNRNLYRKKYKISNNEIVFIYSGGTSQWQCVEETINLYKRIADNISSNSRLLIFSHDIDKVRTITKKDNRIILDSYNKEELEKALCAGDYAFLLRQNCITNKVAFPNKYLEYIHGFLKIITTPYIDEVAKQVTHYKVGCLYNMDSNIEIVINYINEQKNISRIKENIVADILKFNGFKNTLSEFVEELKNEE